MAATYDEDLPTAKDVVRLLIPDTVVASAEWSDEEIVAALALQVSDFGRSTTCAPYFVAADLLDGLVTYNVNQYAGISRKKVDDLEIEYGGRNTSLTDLRSRVDRLVAQGLRCEQVQKVAAGKSMRFRAVGPRQLSTD